MKEQDYINYFENLCKQSKDINHLVDGKKSFFYWDNPFDMEEIDNAFRSHLQFPAFILEAASGVFDNNDSANYTDSVTGSFNIVAKAKSTEEARTVRDFCKEVGLKFLARMSKDSRSGNIVAGKNIHFRVSDVPYDTVGPMGPDVYGYVFNFRLVCPLGFSVDSGTWRDII